MKKALALNAVFSGTSVLGLMVWHADAAAFFGISATRPFLLIGIALLCFSLSILFTIWRQNALAILWIIVQDLLWVMGSIVLLALNPFDVSTGGNYLIGGVALVVLVMALLQARELANLDTTNGPGKKQFRFSRTVRASKAASWLVVSDVASYHQVAPNIDRVKILSGLGKGMVRRCSHHNDSWIETCILWQEEERYSFEVDTHAPDYPYPFTFLQGTWEVKAVDSTHTIILMTFDFAYRNQLQAVFLHPFLRRKFRKVAETLLDNWQQLLEKKPATAHQRMK